MRHAILGFALLAGTAAWAQPADLVLRNGRIVTLDAGDRVVQAVAVRGERIAAVGSEAEIAPLVGPATASLDLGGRTVVPGLIDSHLHQLFAALNGPQVQLLDARSIADVQKAIAARVATTPPGNWVVASSGWHESLLAEGRMPTRHELDAVSPEHPVIIPRGGHVVTVNSKALERAGITKDTPSPLGGVIVRDANGEATGVLLQNAANLARRVQPSPPPPPRQIELLKAAMAELNRHGLTGVVEPGLDARAVAVYNQLRAEGGMTVRTDVLLRGASKADVEAAIKLAAEQSNDLWLRFIGVKFPIDGGVEGARMYRPYRIVPGEQTNPDYRGVLLMPPGGEDEYVESLKLVARAGLVAQTHAVGDETIDAVTRAYKRVDAEFPLKGRRWAVMHIFLPTPDAIRELARMGVMATAQDHPVLLGHNQRRWWGEERAAYAIPIRALIDAGIHVGGGTDGPVLPVDPFLSMGWMTTRRVLAGYVLGPEQAIAPREALRLYTVNNAVLLGTERERGTLETGKLADLAVLSQDILSVPRESIRDTKAVLTVVGGKIVHRAGL
ncbi:MAG: amidohydrolase [Alphaproteobacteria bacterium]|nr:amidohydrolase [Alphaproteobacteria bacterium]